MLERVKQLYTYAVVVGLGVLLITLPLSIPVVTSDEDFSIFNTSWNGCSSLAVRSYHLGSLEPTFTLRGTGTSLQIVQLPPERWRLDPERDSVVIINPELPFTEREGDLLSEFLSSGGVVFLADDFGVGNTLLSHLGTSTRISGKLALDLSFSKKGEFMMVTDIY
ncbi:MAG: DUF4350 domain-containing protein, partial [Thermoplasmata archaeon]|nr:DUF4350 domain-containing protein [Thermoplasmata archaeon]